MLCAQTKTASTLANVTLDIWGMVSTAAVGNTFIFQTFNRNDQKGEASNMTAHTKLFRKFGHTTMCQSPLFFQNRGLI